MAGTTKKNKPITFQISITEIKELRFHNKDIPNDLLSVIDKEPIQIQYSIRFQPLFEDNILKFLLDVKYSHPKLTPDDVLLELSVEFSFFIDILKKVIKKKNKKYFLEDKMLATVSGIAISTARGIIVTKTYGKNINKYYLPIFDPTQFVKSFKGNPSK